MLSTAHLSKQPMHLREDVLCLRALHLRFLRQRIPDFEHALSIQVVQDHLQGAGSKSGLRIGCRYYSVLQASA